MNNEFMALYKKVIIILIVMNFTIGIFYAFTGTSLSVSNPNNTALNTLSGLENTIKSNSASLEASFGAQLITPFTCAYNPCAEPLNYIGILGIPIINFIYDLGIFIVSALVIMGTSFAVVVVMVFGVIPQLFIGGAFGVFNYIAVTVYGFLIFLISGYGLYMLNDIYRAWFK